MERQHGKRISREQINLFPPERIYLFKREGVFCVFS